MLVIHTVSQMLKKVQKNNWNLKKRINHLMLFSHQTVIWDNAILFHCKFFQFLLSLCYGRKIPMHMLWEIH